MRMDRRALRWITPLGLLAALTVFAAASPVIYPPDSSPKDAADEILVYQNGFCQVFQTFHFDVLDGEALISLPAGAILDTLRLGDLEIVEVRSRDGATPFLPGDEVVIVTIKERIQGRLVAAGDHFAIATGNGTRYVSSEHIVSLEVLSADAPTPGRIQVRLRLAEEDGTYDVVASYILRGVAWHATHDLDVETGKLRTWVTLTGSPGFDVARLTVVSGAPRFILDAPRYGGFESATGRFLALTAADSESDTWSSGSLDEYHEYGLGRPIALPAGVDVRLRLFETEAELDHEIVAHARAWSGDVTPQHEWSFTNPLPEPLPAGTLNFYRDGRFIGQDHLRYLPIDERATLVSGEARDIKVKVTTTCLTPDRDHYEISATNRKTDQAEIRIAFALTDRPVMSHLSSGASQGDDEVSWTLGLKQGETGRVSFELHHYHNNQCPELIP